MGSCEERRGTLLGASLFLFMLPQHQKMVQRMCPKCQPIGEGLKNDILGGFMTGVVVGIFTTVFLQWWL